MPKLKLTDLALQNLKPPAQGQVEYWDAALPGFGVRVSQGGSKTFFVSLNRRRRVLGRYPVVSLKEARTEGKHILLDRLSFQKELEQLEVPYAEAVERYLRNKATEIRPRTLEGYARHLQRFDFPLLVSEVRAHHVAEALERVQGQTNRSHAHTVLKVFFGWCLAREYCRSNPLQHLKKPKLPSSRDRVLEDFELAAIWEASQELEKYGSIVRLLMLTGQRKNQIARLQESWVRKESVRFPAEVMKNKQQHTCPFGTWARYELLNVIPVGGYYFSPISAVGQPFSNWSKSKAKLDELAKIDPWRLHDLRRTWSTNAARLDIAPHVTARVLSHTGEENKVWQIYNRHRYEKEMAEAMHKMEEHVLSLVRADTISR